MLAFPPLFGHLPPMANDHFAFRIDCFASSIVTNFIISYAFNCVPLKAFIYFNLPKFDPIAAT